MQPKPLLTIVLLFLATISVNADEGKNCYPITAKDLIREEAPRLDQYPAKVEQIRHPAKVILDSHLARRYRTMLRRGAAKGPNFAGHYAVVVWGCGTSCAQFAVVDLRSGKVTFPEGFSTISGVHFADELETEGDQFWGVKFKIDSRLLIAIGTLDEDDKREGAFYYLLQGGKLKRIFSVNVQKENCDDGFHPRKFTNLSCPGGFIGVGVRGSGESKE